MRDLKLEFPVTSNKYVLSQLIVSLPSFFSIAASPPRLSDPSIVLLISAMKYRIDVLKLNASTFSFLVITSLNSYKSRPVSNSLV